MSDQHHAVCNGCGAQVNITCPHDPTRHGGHGDPLRILIAELGRVGWLATLAPGPPHKDMPVWTYCSASCEADHASERATVVVPGSEDDYLCIAVNNIGSRCTLDRGHRGDHDWAIKDDTAATTDQLT